MHIRPFQTGGCRDTGGPATAAPSRPAADTCTHAHTPRGHMRDTNSGSRYRPRPATCVADARHSLHWRRAVVEHLALAPAQGHAQGFRVSRRPSWPRSPLRGPSSMPPTPAHTSAHTHTRRRMRRRLRIRAPAPATRAAACQARRPGSPLLRGLESTSPLLSFY